MYNIIKILGFLVAVTLVTSLLLSLEDPSYLFMAIPPVLMVIVLIFIGKQAAREKWSSQYVITFGLCALFLMSWMYPLVSGDGDRFLNNFFFFALAVSPFLIILAVSALKNQNNKSSRDLEI